MDHLIAGGYNEGACNKRQDSTLTLRMSLTQQLIEAEAHAAELRARMERLEGTGILDARIEDLAVAMRR